MRSLQGSHLSQGGSHESSPLPEKLLVVADVARRESHFLQWWNH